MALDEGQTASNSGTVNDPDGGVVAISARIFHSLALMANCSPANTAPVAVDDSYTTNEDTPLTVPAPGVLSNDNAAEFNPPPPSS